MNDLVGKLWFLCYKLRTMAERSTFLNICPNEAANPKETDGHAENVSNFIADS